MDLRFVPLQMSQHQLSAKQGNRADPHDHCGRQEQRRLPGHLLAVNNQATKSGSKQGEVEMELADLNAAASEALKLGCHVALQSSLKPGGPSHPDGDG